MFAALSCGLVELLKKADKTPYGQYLLLGTLIIQTHRTNTVVHIGTLDVTGQHSVSRVFAPIVFKPGPELGTTGQSAGLKVADTGYATGQFAKGPAKILLTLL